jgi:hypothetical protein
LLKLTSTLSQYLEGAPIEKKTIAKLVRRASLNAVPFDFKTDLSQMMKESNETEHSIDFGETFHSQKSSENDLKTSQQTPPSRQRLFGLASPIADQSIFQLSHLKTSTPNFFTSLDPPCTPISPESQSRYRIDVPPSSSVDRNPCTFISLTESLEEQCDYLFYRIYTLSHPNYIHNQMKKDYDESKRDVLTEWIGKKTFVSMCLALDVIDDRFTIQAAANCFEKAAQEAMRSQYKLNSR